MNIDTFSLDISNLCAANRDRGEPRGSTPPTPPDMRVRVRRFSDLSPGGPGVRFAFSRWSLHRSRISCWLHPIHPWQAPPKRIGWRMAIHGSNALLPTITVRAFIRCRTNMPSADFCCQIKGPCGSFSHESATNSRSPEVKFDRLPHATGSCTSARGLLHSSFDPRLAATPLRFAIQVVKRTSTSSCRTCSAPKTNGPQGRGPTCHAANAILYPNTSRPPPSFPGVNFPSI